ncbi:ubiquitin-related modifier 1 homolog 2 [Selaginella moellendorffii]|nr:ubiquitin-related modifier 1 homolog 2 [Selaginella moellendorffii]|eukprot:XP_002960558.2 ubiquitin-related modifier 1 homolog 2 [Selaginella moellendorffii]
MRLNLEFKGGLELLFGSVKCHEVELDSNEITVEKLLVWIRENLLKERQEMFLKGKSVRPGVLVLINDYDWELMGHLEAPIKDKDSVVFISTLHGG